MAELPSSFQQCNGDLAKQCWSKGAQHCTDASPTTMSHFRPLWSGLGGWPPASWSSPPALAVSLPFPHFSLSLSVAAVSLFSVSIIKFENDGKTGGKSWVCSAGLSGRRGVGPESQACVSGSHPPARGREAAAPAATAAGTPGDWGVGLMLRALIQATKRLLFSNAVTSVNHDPPPPFTATCH